MVADDLSERGAETNRKLFYGNHRFLPSGKTIVSFFLVAREDVVSAGGNRFLSFFNHLLIRHVSIFA
jgi:hypothetical protein